MASPITVVPDEIQSPHSQFAAAADTIFAANPRVVQQERQQWQEEKGLTMVFDPAKDLSFRRPHQEYRNGVQRVARGWSDEELGQQDQPLLRQVPSNEVVRDDFHRYRWRCIFQPERAVETLGPVAELHLSIIKAKNLHSYELSNMFQPTCNPSCKVYLDDNLICQSKCQQRTVEPEWQFQRSLDVTCPFSMLRVQVVDQGNSNAVNRQIGFVEISIGDLPLNRDIEGWFELRHQESLQRTSADRYAKHCQRRDDDLPNMRLRKQKAERVQTTKDQEIEMGEDASNMTNSGQPQRSFLSSCVTYFSDRSTELGLNVSQALRPEIRDNAGEIMMRLRFSYLNRAKDSFFARALNPPTSRDHGTQTLQAEGNSDFHFQHLCDDLIDVKHNLLEDAVSSTRNFCTYVLHWRSILLSSLLLASVICPLAYTAFFPHQRNLWLWTAVLPGTLGFVHLLLSISAIRVFMLQGGTNAPLTQEGFARAAAWRDTEQVMLFITRVLIDLKGSVMDERELRSFAARSFREGKPRLTMAELRTGLKAAHWVSFDKPSQAAALDLEETDARVLLREGFPSTQLQKGDLVLVDHRTRATVKLVDDPYVVVEYDELDELQAASRLSQAQAFPPSSPQALQTRRDYEGLQPDSPKAEVVHSTALVGKDNLAHIAQERIAKSRVSLRPKVPTVPQKYVPRQLAGEIYSLCIVIDDLKTLLCPVLCFWGDVLCWRRWCISLLFFFVLLLISVASTTAFLLECCIDSSSGAAVAKAAVRYIMMAIKISVAVVMLGIFLRRAKWFVPMRSWFRTCWRYLFHRRLAPKIWPFFKGESNANMQKPA